MCPSNDKEIKIDPFRHGEEKFTLPDNYYKKVEKDWHDASKLMKEGTERAKTSRIDVVGQNGNDGDHYDKQ